MDKKVAIFPIDHHTVSFARYGNLGKYDEVVALVAPSLSVLSEQDISKLDGGRIENVKLHANYKEQIAASDVIYFLASNSIRDVDIYAELIEYAEELHKKVIVSEAVKDQLNKNSEINEYVTLPRLLPIDVPIISVFTMGEKCGHMQVELSLRKHFLKNDYRLLQIGAQEFSSIFGCIELPSFIFDVNMDIEKRIVLFNEFVYELCQKEEPDLIILGVPNSIMKYNDDILSGLGIIPLIIQSAVKSDIGIVNLYYAEYTDQYLDYVSKFCEYRLDIPVKYFAVSNTVVSKNADNARKLEYLYVNQEFTKSNLKKEIGKEDYTVFLGYDDEDAEQAFQNIEQELLGNVSKM